MPVGTLARRPGQWGSRRSQQGDVYHSAIVGWRPLCCIGQIALVYGAPGGQQRRREGRCLTHAGTVSLVMLGAGVLRPLKRDIPCSPK